MPASLTRRVQCAMNLSVTPCVAQMVAYDWPSANDSCSTSGSPSRRSEKLEKLDGGLWHSYRRKWATERKHLPLMDVAAACGWNDVGYAAQGTSNPRKVSETLSPAQ